MQWMMLQQETPDDFVIATGVQYSVRDFITWVASDLGLEIEFSGNGINEIASISGIIGDRAPALKIGDTIMRIDPRYFRPAEVETLLGDPSKAKQELGWVPEISAQEMCSEMVMHDYKEAKKIHFLTENDFGN